MEISARKRLISQGISEDCCLTKMIEDGSLTSSGGFFFYASHNAAAWWLVLDGLHAAS